jgi:hypothetical protein
VSRAWRRVVAALALAGLVVSTRASADPSAVGPVPAIDPLAFALALADPAAADSSAADTTRAPAAPAPAAPTPPPSPKPVPTLQAELKEPPPSRTRGWIALGTGAAVTLGSFFVAKAADQAYDRYQTETDPGAIEDHYQDAKQLDKIAAGMLIAGNAAMALGIYWGFIQRPESSFHRAALAPDVTPTRAGFAVVVPLP